MTDGVFMGHCDACASEIRDSIGYPAVRVVNGAQWKFQFCSQTCKQAFFDRDDLTEVPSVQ